jgi:hypothetical protein
MDHPIMRAAARTRPQRHIRAALFMHASGDSHAGSVDPVRLHPHNGGIHRYAL